MSWEGKDSSVYRTAQEDEPVDYTPVMSETEFPDGFSEAHIVGAYKDYLNEFAKAFEKTVEECDDRDIWNVRYYEGCLEAIRGTGSYRNHRNFSSLIEDCDYRLSEIDEDARSVTDSNIYWKRYFDGLVQTLTEIKKQSQHWKEVMDKREDM